MLGGSWVVISGVISPLIRVLSIVTLLITPLITTHEPPSGAVFDTVPPGRHAQTFQNPLIKEYTLNYNRDPYYDLRYISSLRDFGRFGEFMPIFPNPHPQTP